MLQRIKNLEKAVRYIASTVHKHTYYADGSKITSLDDGLIDKVNSYLEHPTMPPNFGKMEDEINSALIKGGFKDFEIKQLEQCLRYCLHRTKAHNFCGLSKTGIREKEINNLLEKIK